MTSPYTPEFAHTDWPNAALFGNLPAGNSPNEVLHRVEAEFGSVADAFTELAAGGDELDARLEAMRDAINALLVGGLPTAPELPVSAAAGDDFLNRGVLLDGTGGLVVFWSSRRTSTTQVYAARLDLTRPQDGFSPTVAVTSGTTAASAPVAVLLPNGELLVAYTVFTAGGGLAGVRMKRAATLEGLAAATAQTVTTDGLNTHVVLAADRVVFFAQIRGNWAYRRYNPATSTFVDNSTVLLTARGPLFDGELHAAAAGRFCWIAYSHVGGDGEVPEEFYEVRRLDTANGTVTASLGNKPGFVLPVGEAEALVIHMRPGWQAVTVALQGTLATRPLPGTMFNDSEPTVVRDTRGTVHVFFIRVYTSTDRAVMLIRRSPDGEWGRPFQVSRLNSTHSTPVSVFVPGQGVWLVYGSNKTGNVDLYATRILTAI